MATADTKSQILDTAERLFAQKGFDAVSLRNIVTVAKVNLAAVHYHFGSKQSLLHTVVARRLRPINEKRLARLAEAQAKAGKRPVKLERVLECLFLPLFRVQADPKVGPAFSRLIGRVLFDRNADLQKFMMSELAEVIPQFSAALDAALPGLPKEETDWRSHFMAGAMAHTLCNADLLAKFTGTQFDPGDYETTVQRLIEFTAAGFRAEARRKK
jgi:AcrR family transcriptional regulator